ncbi:MFS transporter [Streptomyces sp. NPDC051940]|uniref:MFS transporter n=1 Tax=Streptomyces sp. NPDC051940 TaxID=3155675 RepID=UPI0034395BFB
MLQGVGGGGVIVLTFVLVGDIVVRRERSRCQGVFGPGFYGVASVVGPPLGGVFTDHFSWCWLFLVNLPVGIVALTVATRALPAATRGTKARIDYLGSLLLAANLAGLLLLGTIGAGTSTRC